MLQAKNGTKIKYLLTKIAKKIHINKASQKDWQKSQEKSLWKNSFGAFTCKYSKIPHFIANVRKNITASATKSTQQTKSIIILLSDLTRYPCFYVPLNP